MPILITEEIFQAFLKCETKAYLKYPSAVGVQGEGSDWQRRLIEDFRQKCAIKLRSQFPEDECLVGASLPQIPENGKPRLVINCLAQAQEIRSSIHALERLTSHGKRKHNPYIPIRFVLSEKVTKHDRLLLAFDALALSLASGKMPPFGKIIHGSAQKSLRVQLVELMKTARSVVERIAARQESPAPPPLILNKHCAECEFQARCSQVAVEKDELSLLSGMTEKERRKQHDKGIFTVTQLSYTFRPRRKPKRLASRPEKYHPELKALALREQKIHIAGRPELNITGTPVYLDVEGVPDRDFYYLIGLRIGSGGLFVQHSFWADDAAEEKDIWASVLHTLAQIENPQLLHYGSYETIFLKRMKERYGAAADNPSFVDQVIAGSVNLLSVIYAQIYFPTYSNSLKEIAQYLDFHWSESGASGLKALMWRSEWESSEDATLKQKLITYNTEDCEALERVAEAVAQLCYKQTSETARPQDDKIVYIDSLKREYPQRLGDIIFVTPELEYLNRAAYWDHQRQKVYIRSSRRLKRVSRSKVKGRARLLPANKVIECPAPSCCPTCKATEFLKHNKRGKVVYDLKFGRAGVKRWVSRFVFYRYSCCACGMIFFSQQRPHTGEKYGLGILAYIIYQIVELQLPQIAVTKNLNQSFNFDLERTTIKRQKARAAQIYQGAYEGILNKIISGRLVHADETKVSISGKNAFVWVVTSLEEVAYFYSETREGEVIRELLREFKGVLVSDFYTAYDTINCPQQKCLIHLIRDLNEDIFKQPFNVEFKNLVQDFAALLKPIIETVDRFGLKAHFLRKHKDFVERFYKSLSKQDYQSEVAIKYKKRFEKNNDKLFTFLDYDGVPWNNNNAEHAIKAFARLRNVIRGSSSDRGIREYLTLLSVCETCKYKGVNFLEFLRSGKRDVDEFIKKTNHL